MDIVDARGRRLLAEEGKDESECAGRGVIVVGVLVVVVVVAVACVCEFACVCVCGRSEEHTSELQSRI